MFSPRSLEESQHMTVGDCNNIPTHVRWEHETKIFGDLLLADLTKISGKKILSFGCGSGRLEKYILANDPTRQIEITGVDQSPQMLSIAKSYVLSDRFTPQTLHDYLSDPAVYDFGLCVYVLQHIPAIDLRDLLETMQRKAPRWLFVNSVCRMAVNKDSFFDDGVNVFSELDAYFTNFTWALPVNAVMTNHVMRAMFLEGQTMHYALYCDSKRSFTSHTFESNAPVNGQVHAEYEGHHPACPDGTVIDSQAPHDYYVGVPAHA